MREKSPGATATREDRLEHWSKSAWFVVFPAHDHSTRLLRVPVRPPRLPAVLRAAVGDVAIIDTPWNRVAESAKIAAMADAYEVNVAPYNF